MELNNITECRKYFNIPVELIEYAYHKKYEKEFRVYLYLKSKSDGIINEALIDYADFRLSTGIHDKRTFNKYRDSLLKLNWIGYNKDSKNYFIRGFGALRENIELKKRSGVILKYEDIKNLKSFMEGVIICKSVRAQNFVTKKALLKKVGQAASKNGGALQADKFLVNYPAYYGLSNLGIGRKLICSQSHANRAKKSAEKRGFIQTNKKEQTLAIVNSYDSLLKLHSEEGNKIIFRKISGGRIKVSKQLHDEIIPLITFSRVGRV
ncbi:MAG: hypothetical protein Q8L07_15030 [Sediminibacterium sp.]|nr:hypothetical protein [Sediminibacterium sp.]